MEVYIKTRIYQIIGKNDDSHYHIKYVQMISHHIVKYESMLCVIELCWIILYYMMSSPMISQIQYIVLYFATLVFPYRIEYTIL